MYTVVLNNTVTRVGNFQYRQAARKRAAGQSLLRKDGQDVALRKVASTFGDDPVTHRQSGPGKMSKYFMISRLTLSALHMTARAFGIARFAGLLGLMGLVAACGGGGGSGSGGGGGGGGGNNPPVVTLSSIAVAPTGGNSASVVAGLTLQLAATGTYSDGTTKDLSSTVAWTSSANATVTSAGLVTGVSAGSATVTAATGGVSGNVALTVAPPNLLSVVLSPNKPNVAVHKVLQFRAIATYSNNTTDDVTSSVTFSSSNPAVASVGTTDTSAVTANTLGTANINGSMAGATITPVTVTVTATIYAYATNFDSDTVSQYQLGSTDGALTPLATGTVDTDHQPFSISVEPTGEYVYVSNWSSNSVSQFRIGSDGTLVKIGTGSVATGSFPNAVTVDPADKYAYVANLGESTISQYKIGLDGQLMPMATPKVAAGASPATIVVDPTGHFAYAGNFGANAKNPPAGPSTISQYTVSQTDGSLMPMTGAAVTVAAGSGPNAIAIDPAAQHLYVVNLGDNNVGQYSINTDGTLTLLTTVAAPAGTVTSGAQPAGLAIDPTGHYLYVANQGDGNISQYTIGGDGGLTPMGAPTVSSGLGTSAVTIDPTGQYLYATNRGETTISQFKIGAGGALMPMTTATVAAGTHPTAIATGY